MSIPTVHNFPIKRPGFIQSCEWMGTDPQLSLRLTFFNEGGTLTQIQFQTRHAADGSPGEVCLPASNVLTDLGPRWEDILRAHTRMACLVARSGIPGSDEFLEALLNGQTQNLQTAIGVVKVVGVASIPGDDVTVKLSFRQGTGPILDVMMDYGDLNNYTFAPETQLLVIPGSIEKQFPTYIHDYPTTVLTEQRKQEIVDYVMAREPWI